PGFHAQGVEDRTDLEPRQVGGALTMCFFQQCDGTLAVAQADVDLGEQRRRYVALLAKLEQLRERRFRVALPSRPGVGIPERPAHLRRATGERDGLPQPRDRLLVPPELGPGKPEKVVRHREALVD